ncbi:hypothetical protein N7486_001044 [Penicillium sp. IBT 16267x]|nr:hypothetical protein N7486_001044 [Penicillium sp. IBT 16267x]
MSSANNGRTSNSEALHPHFAIIYRKDAQKHGHYKKPVIVGLYGLPGAGKTFLLDKLKRSVVDFLFFDGSRLIGAVTPGGLESFHTLPEAEKVKQRERAMGRIKQGCHDFGKSAIVAGHAMLWPDGEMTYQLICTQADLDSYTHIVYLEVPAGVIAEHRRNDQRGRPAASVAHLAQWQAAEKRYLRYVCRLHDILFITVTPHESLNEQISALLGDFHSHTEDLNTKLAESHIDEMFNNGSDTPETVLVLDADKTLAPQDSGALFWKLLPPSPEGDDVFPLKTLFRSPLQYSYTAFRQATLLYEEARNDEEYEACCQQVASMVEIYPEFVNLLYSLKVHMRAVVLTCGLRRVWELVLGRAGLSAVQVIGGGRLSDKIVMTPALKASLVKQLRFFHNAYVWAFGDSPVDLDMLKAANKAIVVAGNELSRSTTMDEALRASIGHDGFEPRQLLLPSDDHAQPRLSVLQLPTLRLTDESFLNSISPRRNRLRVFHATKHNGAKLMMTAMRDATISGPVLRQAHQRVGWYLTMRFYADMVGIEPYSITHVQGHQTDGYRAAHEMATLIVALMRGGEPMALGVNEALPLATFLHAKDPVDIPTKHLSKCVTFILVDSVINTGKSVLEFIQHIRKTDGTIRIVVMAGVIHSQTLSTGRISQEFSRIQGLSFIALRLSDNHFTGQGATDTGNRLFNTVHLD